MVNGRKHSYDYKRRFSSIVLTSQSSLGAALRMIGRVYLPLRLPHLTKVMELSGMETRLQSQ